MKQTRLLEIIREEIAGALNEMGQSPEDQKATTLAIAAEKAKIAAAQKQLQQLQKSGVSESELEEDLLNEKPDFGGQLDKEVAAKYGEEDTLEAATEKITNRVLSDKGLTKAEVAKMDKDALKALLKDIRAFISQKNRTPEVTAALEKQKEIEASRPGGYTGKQLQDNQTNKAILRALGFESKKGPKGPTKPKAEKPASTGKKGRPAGAPKAEKIATRTKGDDGMDDVSYSDVDSEDKEATQNIGSDSTAKKLGKEADVSKNPDFDRIRKGLQNKRKNSKDGILSPEDMKLAINIINTAKDKYKFNTTQVDSLRADIGL
jgi:hypothetical protein